jgi:hypothetical protein
MALTFCNLCGCLILAANFNLHRTRSKVHLAKLQRRREAVNRLAASPRSQETSGNDPSWNPDEDSDPDDDGDAPMPGPHSDAEALQIGGDGIGDDIEEDIGAGTNADVGDADMSGLGDNREHVAFADAGKFPPGPSFLMMRAPQPRREEGFIPSVGGTRPQCPRTTKPLRPVLSVG